jgi:hypothetical protein
VRAGNGNKITRCEVTLDDGDSWILGEITQRTPPNFAGRHWAWVWWEVQVPFGEDAAQSCFARFQRS